jgi:hypothetical protein
MCMDDADKGEADWQAMPLKRRGLGNHVQLLLLLIAVVCPYCAVFSIQPIPMLLVGLKKIMRKGAPTIGRTVSARRPEVFESSVENER